MRNASEYNAKTTLDTLVKLSASTHDTEDLLPILLNKAKETKQTKEWELLVNTCKSLDSVSVSLCTEKVLELGYDGEENNGILVVENWTKIVKKLYDGDNEKWVKEYITALNNLANIYFSVSRHGHETVIEIEEISKNILEPLYDKDNEKWAEEYMRTLGQLSDSHYQKYHSDKYIASTEGGKVSHESQDQYVSLRNTYTKMLHSLYYKDNTKWRADYLDSLNMLAYRCSGKGAIDEGIALMEESQDIYQSLTYQDKLQLEESYAFSLRNLYSLYDKKGMFTKAMSFLEQKRDFYKDLYYQDNALWGMKYLSSLSDMAMPYRRKGLYDKAISLQKEDKEIALHLYTGDNAQWASRYATSLSWLANIYDRLGRLDEAIELYEKSEKILHPLYLKDKQRHSSYTLYVERLAFARAKKLLKEQR